MTWLGHDWLDAHRPKSKGKGKAVVAKAEPEKPTQETRPEAYRPTATLMPSSAEGAGVM
jgi:hypothetical protein